MRRKCAHDRREAWCGQKRGARRGDVAGVILTVLDQPSVAGALLGASHCLAGLCQAKRINALLVRSPPEALLALSEEVLTTRREADLREVEAARARAVRTIFDAWA